MDLSDSRPDRSWVMSSHKNVAAHPHGTHPVKLASPCRASQVPVHRFLDRSFSTRHPQSPRRTSRLLTPVASPSVLGFATFGRLAALTWCNEAESGSLALWLIPSPTQGFAKPDYSDPRLSGYMSNRLFTWWTPPSPQDRPDLAWRTEGHEE